MPKGKTILVVDDDSTVLELIATILSMQGYEVLRAFSGEEAIRTCKGGGTSIDLLLLDVIMPFLSGPEVVQALRDAGLDIRAVYISGYSEESVSNKVHGLSEMRFFVRKPFTPAQLLAAVSAALGQDRKPAGREPGGVSRENLLA